MKLSEKEELQEDIEAFRKHLNDIVEEFQDYLHNPINSELLCAFEFLPRMQYAIKQVHGAQAKLNKLNKV